jgi:ferric-dicitrate binding protein FerR (iron transport regulator)
MLAKSPTTRPGSSAAVAHAWTRFAEGHDLAALLGLPPSEAQTTEKQSPHSRWRRLLAIATAGLLISIVSGAIWTGL